MRVVEILRDLIAFPTPPERPNRLLLDYIAAHLRRLRVEPVFLLEAQAERGGLVAIIGRRSSKPAGDFLPESWKLFARQASELHVPL